MEKKKILVVEDEKDVQSYIMTFLEDNGYETLGAGDGQEGLQIAKKEGPDLITLDISMPEKSGVKTLQELQQDPATEKIPVIVVTGVSEDLEKFIQHRKKISPPAGYIFKPIETKELLEMVQRLTS